MFGTAFPWINPALPLAIGQAGGDVTPGGVATALLLEGDMADDPLDAIVLEGDMAGGVLLLEGDMAT